MNISPARKAAFDILLRVQNEKAFASVLLPIFEENLAAADGALCHELTLGTLRRQIYLDRVIDLFAGGKKLDIEVRMALRLGLYQLYFLTRIPAYSAINESVNLVVRSKKRSAKGFANAILRRASRESIDLMFADETDRISVETSHPRWLIEKWIGDFGEEEAALIAAANNEVPETAFRIIGEPTEEVRRLIEGSRPSSFVAGSYLTGNRFVFDLAKRGNVYIQDEASQMVAHSVDIPKDGYFLDVCAAPGGKTGLIADRNKANTALAVAGDLHRPRVEFLRNNCRRQGMNFVEIVQYDAEYGLPFSDRSFDVVLVDAPCSGTGTIRRNPEIRYFIGPPDFTALSAKQLSILLNASKLIRPGGLLIYSTCSLEKEENEGVCGQFLSSTSHFESVAPNVPDVFATDSGFARTWPHRYGMDGFFSAAFRRVSSEED